MYRYELKFFRGRETVETVAFSKDVLEEVIRHYLDLFCLMNSRLRKKEFYKIMRFVNGTEKGHFRDNFIEINVKRRCFNGI